METSLQKKCVFCEFDSPVHLRNSGSTNGQMTSLRPPAASVSSQTGAGQAVDYLSTCLLLSAGQAVDNNAVCLSGQRSRDPIIRTHPIQPFLSCRVLFVDFNRKKTTVIGNDPVFMEPKPDFCLALSVTQSLTRAVNAIVET